MTRKHHIIISAFTEKPGRSSFMAHYEIMDENVLYTTGSSKIVWIDYEKGKSVELPDKIVTLLT